MMVHSAIGGPWMPELEVRGMEVSLTMGWERRWSRPEEREWMILILDLNEFILTVFYFCS